MRAFDRAVAVAAAILIAAVAPLDAQGQGQGGQGQGRDRDKPAQASRGKPAQARPDKPAQANRDKAQARPGQQQGQGPKQAAVRRVTRPVRMERLPERYGSLVRAAEPSGRLAAQALARGHEYGDMPVKYLRTDDGYRVLNRRDDVLFDMSDDEARRLGYWDVRRLDPDRVREDAPAFCRSGAGHPVWGREWCIDKGFGLGGSDGWLWGRHRPDDVIFGSVDERARLDRGGLIDVLGSIIFNRLAVHAVTLGLADPLAGEWLGEREGPRVLTLKAGPVPVAELVDWDRNGSVDVMYVVSRDDY